MAKILNKNTINILANTFLFRRKDRMQNTAEKQPE
jgi:hypothetical protein